ncbi:unnamed protein product, partial [Anisakis simplex]|uniref:Cullin domain-containing protein n=1 Tax=Anisakis simplex TaxID=6269 RepID=A0A0M3JJ34_ANISI
MHSIFGTNSEVYGRVLNERLKCWYEEVYAREEDRIVEDYIELAYHIVRKCWKLIVANLNETMHTLKLWTAVSVKVLNSSNDPSKCRESARLLSTLLKNCGDSGQA